MLLVVAVALGREKEVSSERLTDVGRLKEERV